MRASLSLLLLPLSLFLNPLAADCQVFDSTGVKISRLPDTVKNNELYEVSIYNLRSVPICILHSAYINLVSLPPAQRLAAATEVNGRKMVSLHNSARDTLNDYENTNPNYNAEPILPMQFIRFLMLVPKSSKPKRLLIEYYALPDFCYADFKKAIFDNAATWYEGYTKRQFEIDLPQQEHSIRYSMDSTFFSHINESAVEMFMDNFADSLNKIPITKKFPTFLADAQFDYDHAGFAPSHNPNPSRYLIISKVNYCRALIMILDSKNEKYKKRPVKDLRIEVAYADLSFYELVERRYKEMGCPLMY